VSERRERDVAQRSQLTFAHPGGVEGAVRAELLDDHAAYWMYVDLVADGFVTIRHDEVALPRGRLFELRADGLWAELVCEVTGEHWTFGLEAFGLRHESRDEARTADVGERVPVGFDLEWDEGRVVGEVLVGRRRFAVDGPGEFTQDDDAPAESWAEFLGSVT
jgi:hypothetical protein